MARRRAPPGLGRTAVRPDGRIFDLMVVQRSRVGSISPSTSWESGLGVLEAPGPRTEAYPSDHAVRSVAGLRDRSQARMILGQDGHDDPSEALGAQVAEHRHGGGGRAAWPRSAGSVKRP